MKKRIISLFLAVVMIAGVVPFGAITASAETTHTLNFTDAYEQIQVNDGECLPAEDIPKPNGTLVGKLPLGWQYEKGGEKYFFNEAVPVTEDLTLTFCEMSVKEITDYTDKKEITTSDKTSLNSLSGIYTVSVGSDIVIDNRCAVIGFAVIILPDGCNITFSKGIEVPEYRKLFIIAPDGAKGTGKLTANGGDDAAGIGGGDGGNNGTVYIYGGTVTATGGAFGAGIGGGNGGNGGTVHISGGAVTATGGVFGAGIGGGYGSGANGDGGTVYISGGTVTATGGAHGAGIGGGYGRGGKIYISGGTVNATGGKDAAGIGNGWSGNGAELTISGGVVRATGQTAFGGDVTLRSNMTAYDITNGEENASMTSENTSAAKILAMPTAYDYLAVERNAYIDTGYKPTNNTRVVMNVDVKGGREYWFGVWDIDYCESAFAFGNDVTGIYTGYGDEGGTYGKAVSNGYHTVELDKNSVKLDGNTINTHRTAEFQLNNTLYLFAQNRAGEATVYTDQSAVIHCYGCEIYEGGTLVRKFVPGKSSSFASGLWDVVNGVFYDNQYESKEHYAGMTAYYTGNVEDVSEQPSCTENYHSTYYKKSGKYYTDAQCTDEITDLSVWLSTSVENGGGMLPPLGHDWTYSPEKHVCSRCKLEESHEDTDCNKCCDVCGNGLTDAYDIVYLNRTVNETTGKVTSGKTRFTGYAYTVLGSDKVWGESKKTTWLILDQDVTLSNRPEVKGDVRLILTNGKTLTANNGITVEAGNSLSIYAQSDDESKMGVLRITAPNGQTAIGGRNGKNGVVNAESVFYDIHGKDGYNSGKIYFCGGKVTLESQNAPCIGGGAGGNGANADGTMQAVTIGGNGGKGGDGGNVYFYGGYQTLTATNASAIGGGVGGKGGSGPTGSGDNGRNGGNATVTFYGTPIMKAGDDAESAAAVDGYNGQKYLQVLPSYEYYEYNATEKTFERKFTKTVPTPIQSIDDDIILEGGWYLVSDEVTVKSVTFKGNAHVIIANGALFTATNGISAINGAKLTFYAQTEDFDQMGKVVATGYSGNAGIGSKRQGECGDITINGGTFIVEGGADAAGIGAGWGGKCGTVTINGGKVFSIGGGFGAGIGSGYKDNEESDCEGVVINGGAILAVGNDGADSIGAGKDSQTVTVTYADGVYVNNGLPFACINIKPFPEIMPSCVDGHKEYFKNCVSGKYYTTETLEPDSLIENIEEWLAGEGNTGKAFKDHKDTDNDGFCDTCGTLATAKINFYVSHGNIPAFTLPCIAGEKLIDQIDDLAILKVENKFGTLVGLVNYMYSNGNLVKEYDLVPFGTESMDIYAVLAYDETEPNCFNNGHKAYYENTLDGCFYEDALCTTYIGDAAALDEWLSDEGLNGTALGHIDENGDGCCERCTTQFVEIYPEVASTCETPGHKAYYKNTIDNLFYEDVQCTVKIGSSNQLQTWLSGIGNLPLAEHHLGSDGTCSHCGRVLTKYYVFNEETKEFELKGQTPVTQIVASSDNLSLTAGWYLIEYNENKITVTNRITVSGNVHIILANGAELIAEQGIGIANYGSLTVYAQTLDTSKMGRITVSGAPKNCAGIGSGYEGTCGAITINGGVVTATGGYNGAGIGNGKHGTCAGITINGGVVTANGGYNGTGIGSGEYGTCGDIVINGGVIKAISGDYGAGIGSGYYGTCAGITINGGVVTASSGYEAAGIGDGFCATCLSITVNGGVIKSTGGKYGAGIGSGDSSQSKCGNITINGGVILATGGKDANDIGSGWNGICGTITYKDGVVHKNKDGSEWVNLEYIEGQAATCTEPGANEAYKNLTDEKCYSVFPFTDADLIEVVIPAKGHSDSDRDGKCDTCGNMAGYAMFDGISLTLGSDIAINFYMELTDEARQNGKMTFDIGGRIVTVDGKDAKYNSTEKKYYFSTPLTVLEMNETVTATFTYNGVEYIQTYSVAEYLEKILGGTDEYGNPYPDKMKALAKKIANYGHYAQTYLASIHTGVTVGEDGYTAMYKFEDADIDVTKAIEALANYKVTVSGTSDNLKLFGSTVYFDSATALNYYVTVENGVEPTATAVNKATNVAKDVEVKLYKNNIYIVSVKDVTATELADDIEVKINDEITLTGSVFAYCNSVVKAHNIDGATEKDTFAVNAMAAFYEYYKAAVEYADTQG